MKIIAGLTEQEQIEVIQKVVGNHRNKDFGIYSPEDIEQEAWVIVLSKIDEFVPLRGTQKDIKKSLEHWLNPVVSNRLKNHFRDKFLVPQGMIKGKREKIPNNLMSALDLAFAYEDKSTIFFEDMDLDIWDTIVRDLDPALSDVLDAVLSGEVIGCYHKTKLFRKIRAVIAGYKDSHGGE